ncbi:unnamed protein product [Schistosoma mattheei]|uniref:Uncharacterized protein n=1 Tax=Schistosoma mattheei TaxID=31246 RepID=A0A183NTY0_9TREM|nr:unnamed protein product [Schistosoma mattheei]
MVRLHQRIFSQNGSLSSEIDFMGKIIALMMIKTTWYLGQSLFIV